MSSRVRSFVQYGAITLIGAAFLYFVFRGTDWSDLFEKFRETDYSWIALGMVIALASHVIRAYRANMLYEVLGYRVSLSNSFCAVMIGYMMNYLIPRAGEVSRCAALSKTNRIPVNKSLGTVVTERIFDMVILLVILVVVFLTQFELLSNYLSDAFSGNTGNETTSSYYLKLALAGIVMGAAAVFFLFRKKLIAHPLYLKLTTVLKGFGEGLLSIRQVKRPILFITLSLAIWLCYILMMYVCFFAMNATSGLSFSACLTVFAIGTVGVVIPAPGAGAGTYHFAVMQSLLLFGVPENDGKAYATIVHGAQMILFLAIGAICSLVVLSMQKRNQAVQS